MTRWRAPGKKLINATKTEDHDSIGEGIRAADLDVLHVSGHISDLVHKPTLDIVINGIKIGIYTPDSMYKQQEGIFTEQIVEDFKGFITKESSYRIKVASACYPLYLFNLVGTGGVLLKQYRAGKCTVRQVSKKKKSRPNSQWLRPRKSTKGLLKKGTSSSRT